LTGCCKTRQRARLHKSGWRRSRYTLSSRPPSSRPLSSLQEQQRIRPLTSRRQSLESGGFSSGLRTQALSDTAGAAVGAARDRSRSEAPEMVSTYTSSPAGGQKPLDGECTMRLGLS
jgi:hypothetical protein